MNFKLIGRAALTMVAFAANSVFCRLALVDPANDPVSFTSVRLLAGATALLAFFVLKKPVKSREKFSPKTILAPLALLSYALFFSLSYVQVSAGMGALILFATVQLTMIAAALVQGQRLNRLEWAGVALGFTGFIVLVAPGISMPPILGAVFMAISGVSWAAYTLLGQKSVDPVYRTARNFLWTVPMVGVIFCLHNFQLTSQGIFWAVVSGALTSGMGYVLWYIVLENLKTSTAAIIQLSVPAIAAFAGVLFLGETIDQRLVVATALLFSGITLKVTSTKKG